MWNTKSKPADQQDGLSFWTDHGGRHNIKSSEGLLSRYHTTDFYSNHARLPFLKEDVSMHLESLSGWPARGWQLGYYRVCRSIEI